MESSHLERKRAFCACPKNRHSRSYSGRLQEVAAADVRRRFGLRYDLAQRIEPQVDKCSLTRELPLYGRAAVGSSALRLATDKKGSIET